MSSRSSKPASRWLLVVGVIALAIVPTVSPRSAPGAQKRIIYYNCTQNISQCMSGRWVSLPGVPGGGTWDEACAEQCRAAHCQQLDCLTTCTANSTSGVDRNACNDQVRNCSSNAHPMCGSCSCKYDQAFSGTPQNGKCGCFAP